MENENYKANIEKQIPCFTHAKAQTIYSYAFDYACLCSDRRVVYPIGKTEIESLLLKWVLA